LTKDKALKLALEALESMSGTILELGEQTTFNENQAIAAIKEALAQPPQEPVAWSWRNCFNDDGTQTGPWVRQLSTTKPRDSVIYKDVTPLYTTPPQRPWVGLTDEQFTEAARLAEDGNYLVAFQRIQQWLKEKNT
jgi:hypothetical protein